jgi:YidC/Oxa1 family membrane protein insertase
MNSRILLIFLYAFTLSLAVQYFFFPKAENTSLTQTQQVFLQVDKDSLTIPNIPKIDIVNQSTGTLALSTCRDITITVDTLPLQGIEKDAKEFCQDLVIPPGETMSLPMKSLYRYFSSLSGRYIITTKTPLGDRTIPIDVEKPGAFRSALSGVFYEPIYNLFIALITFLPGHSLGWAIVVITLIIRLILLAPQHHMLMSQKKLQVLQPKIKEIQAKYKDDQAKLGMEMLELYKKEGVNPMGSCLPLLIQMPILIGLYWVISGANDPSNFYHLYSFFKDFNPLSINSYFYGLDLQHVGGAIGITFALILGLIQWVQAKLSFSYNPPVKSKEIEVKKEGEAPEFALDPQVMQKMMLYVFPVMIAVSSYFFPLGVGLYWFIGTVFVIVQQWYVNTISEKRKNRVSK